MDTFRFGYAGGVISNYDSKPSGGVRVFNKPSGTSLSTKTDAEAGSPSSVSELISVILDENMDSLRSMLPHPRYRGVINSRDHSFESHTPLAAACGVPSNESATLSSTRIEIIRMLIDAGADVDSNHGAALTAACEIGCDKAAMILLDAEATPFNMLNASSQPLWIAVRNNLSLKLIKSLVRNGADVNIDDGGRNLIMLAADRVRPDIIEYLAGRGVDVNYADENGHAAVHEVLSSFGLSRANDGDVAATLKMLDKLGATGIERAIYKSRREKDLRKLMAGTRYETRDWS
jgi:hypothetical protein